MKVLTFRLMASLMLFLSWVSYAFAQETQESVVVYFHKESASFEANYKDNGVRMESFFDKVRELQKVSDFVMLKVESIGTASQRVIQFSTNTFQNYVNQTSRSIYSRILRFLQTFSSADSYHRIGRILRKQLRQIPM